MATLVHALHRPGRRHGLQTMCEGDGSSASESSNGCKEATMKFANTVAAVVTGGTSGRDRAGAQSSNTGARRSAWARTASIMLGLPITAICSAVSASSIARGSASCA